MRPDIQLTSDSDLDSLIELDSKLKQKRRNSTGPKYTCSITGCEASFKRLDQLDRHEYHHTGIKKHACAYDGCDKTYSIVTHLKRHLRTTHERPGTAPQKNIMCAVTECDKMFTSASNMQRHMREAHEHPREYPCSYCDAKFTQKLKLRRHEITKHTKNYPFNCSKCKRGFYQKWQQESHQRSCKQYPCSNCSLNFDKWTLYLQHCRETQHGQNRHKCEHCERSYDRASDLSKHIKAKHSKPDIETSSTYTCEEPGCGRSYSYERNLRQHMQTAHAGRRFECVAVDCGSCFSSAQNLAKHLARDHKSTKRTSSKPALKSAKLIRKRRRDAGLPVRSHLAKMSCLQLDRNVDKLVRERNSATLDNIANELEAQMEQPEDETVIEELLSQALQDKDDN